MAMVRDRAVVMDRGPRRRQKNVRRDMVRHHPDMVRTVRLPGPKGDPVDGLERNSIKRLMDRIATGIGWLQRVERIIRKPLRKPQWSPVMVVMSGCPVGGVLRTTALGLGSRGLGRVWDVTVSL